MRKILPFLARFKFFLIPVLSFAIIIDINAQVPGECDNLGFVDGDLTDWNFFNGCHPNAANNTNQAGSKFATGCHVAPKLGTGCCGDVTNLWGANDTDIDVREARHTLMSAGTDKFGNFSLIPPAIPGYPESKFSLRLGNAIVYGQADMVERTFAITEDNAIFAYQFAFVLNDPTVGHGDDNPDGATLPYYQLPYFEAGIFDEDDKAVKCSNFIILADNDDLVKLEDVADDTVLVPNCGDITPCPKMTVRYKDWTPVFMDLTDYIGKSVTLRFKNSDCARGGHWGYSYVSAFVDHMFH